MKLFYNNLSFKLKDENDPRCPHTKAQLLATFLIMAKDQLSDSDAILEDLAKRKNEFHVYGIITKGHWFEFYKMIVSRKYLMDLRNGIKPTDQVILQSLRNEHNHWIPYFVI